jgi:thymidylate synthase ThyX
MTDVHIIADSKNEFGQRCISAICTFPRYLLAEVNTHRILSRNSASSRAIRFEKMVESVQKNPFIPSKWQKDHAGMQGTEYFSQEEVNTKNLVPNWLAARDKAIGMAQVLSNLGVTKQICNRLLEPFMYHTALITATELENFFALRAHDMAEVHLQELAYKYLEACNKSEPKLLKAG